MCLLFSFVNPDRPHGTLLAGYFSKVHAHVISARTCPFILLVALQVFKHYYEPNTGSDLSSNEKASSGVAVFAGIYTHVDLDNNLNLHMNICIKKPFREIFSYFAYVQIHL